MSISDINSVLNNSLTNVFSANSSTCNIADVNSQTINISDIQTVNCNVNINDISNKIQLSSQQTCLITNSNTANLQSQFQTTLANNLNANPAVTQSLMSETNTTNMSDLVNNVTTNLHFDNMAECIETAINNQKINISGIKVYCAPGPYGPTNPQGSLNISNVQNDLYGIVVQSCVQDQVNNFINGLNQTQGPGLIPAAVPLSNQGQTPTQTPTPTQTQTQPGPIFGYKINDPIGISIITAIIVGSILVILLFIYLFNGFTKQTQQQQQQQQLFGLKKYRKL